MAKSRIKKNTRIKQRKRVKRKKKEKAKRFLRGVGKLSLVFLVIAGVAIAGKKGEEFLFTSPYFRISTVNFVGFNSVEKKTLEKLANIEPGKNIFRIDLGGVKRRLQSHPQVKEVFVSRQFPRTLEIRVEERKAIAFVKNEGKIYSVDKEGFIISEASLSRNLPLITGLDWEGMKVGEQIKAGKFIWALEILEISPSLDLPISEIVLEGQSPVILIRGVKVFLGEEKKRGEELKRLKAILNDLKKRKERAEYIDLRFNNPVVRLRKEI
ncbi:MAG: FtsQ-type POTRA domain-containing protein [Nitrospirae bacterium]|nr:FtsQ-type POTRA domain-containing protein [Nitrospirota bacterium]